VTDGTADALALEVRDLWAGYDGQSALEGATFNIESGCLAGLVGPNGSGKSTLMRVILGLHKPWRGDIRIFGSSRRPDRRRLGYTPQSEQVDWSFPVTVLDMVLMGRYSRLGPLRRPTKVDREISWQALESVNLADLAHRRAGELSGGQQRRALIARALAQEADLLLLDEPFAGLDATAEHDLIALLEGLRHLGKTLLVATHDLSCVAADFDHAILLNRKVVAAGLPSDMFTEELLNATFQRHLLLVRLEGRTYVSHG
jgi:ABC-type Mn2+/Zn2+ transport system ATPase subunit